MRLLLVNSAWPPSWGGGEKWFVEASVWFANNGHKVRLAGRPDSRLVRAARARGVDAVETPFGGDFDPRAVARARKIISAFEPEIILVNFNKEAFHFGLAARKMSIPVAARHGLPLWKARVHHRWLARRLLAGVIVNAASLWEEYRSLGIAPRYVAVIPNGVEITEQKQGELRRRCGVAHDRRLIVAAGRLESQKRLDRVIEIVVRLVPTRPDVICLIAGEGPLRSELEEQIRARSLEGHIHLAGFVEDFASLCGDADLFLLTSDQEGMPNVLLEAMAAGVACVSLAVGSVPQMFSGELAANLVPTGDVDGMCARVAALMDDPALRCEVGRQMQMRAADYSLESSLRRYEEVLQQMIGLAS
ncbi:MAG: glycosyltransferase [bacterium]|nr:glycosyltransferase [bacterium]